MREREVEIEREIERERYIDRGESKLEGDIPYVIVLFSPQKIAIYPSFCDSVLTFLKRNSVLVC